MSFVWDAKNNFLLVHFINRHHQQSSTFNINWSTIVHHIRLDINSTPILLQRQYEHLLDVFQLKNNSEVSKKSLYSIVKRDYLHFLCRNIEDDDNLTLISVYQLLKHARAKQIDSNDIQQLINHWNFNSSSDEQKAKKDRLLNILNRLCDAISQISSYLTKEKIIENDCECVINTEFIIDNDQEKLSANRRRTRSLTVSVDNQSNKTNIGVEWFVPLNKRQQRSSSLHARSHSSTRNHTLTLQHDESNEIQIHSVSSCTQITDKQKRSCTKLNFIDDEDLEQISSSESESLSENLNENSRKRQRVS